MEPAKLSEATLRAAVRATVQEQFGDTLSELPLVDASFASQMLAIRLNDLPKCLPRVNVAQEGEKPRYRYRLRDIQSFLNQRTTFPPSKNAGKIRK